MSLHSSFWVNLGTDMGLNEKWGMYKTLINMKFELNRMVPANSVVTK